MRGGEACAVLRGRLREAAGALGMAGEETGGRARRELQGLEGVGGCCSLLMLEGGADEAGRAGHANGVGEGGGAA